MPILLLALIGVSFAAPLVRLSHADPLAIAVWRLGFSLIVVAIALIATRGWRQWRALDRRSVGVALGAGAMLALHFWSWNTSIGLTSVAASVVLVNAQPAIVGLLSAVWLREPPSRIQWIGIAVAMAGAFVVALPEMLMVSTAHGARALLGDALALVGAVAGAVYFVSGRRLRATLDLWPYVGIVYGVCFIVLLGLAFVTQAHLAPQPRAELGIFAALALGPMLLGHTGFNWALKYLPAHVVNLALLGEPVGATLLAAVLPGIRETPSVATLLGGAVILGGVWAAARATSTKASQASASSPLPMEQPD